MPRKIRVGVIFGGRSGEHEVSLVSATSVIEHLDRTKYEVILIGMSKQGRWITGKTALHSLKQGSELAKLTCLLSTDPLQKGLLPLNGALETTDAHLQPLDVVFPVLHGPYGEDGKIQGLLEMADIPYVGADVLGSVLGMDKVIQKQLFSSAGIPVTRFWHFNRKQWNKNPQQITQQILDDFSFPLFVKPANLGSSVGINKVKALEHLAPAISDAAQYDAKILIEEGIPQAREIEFSVLGNDEPVISEPGEIIPSNEFYDYNAKYVDGKSELIIPAPLEATLKSQMQVCALKAYTLINAKGMGRVDFLLENGTDHFVVSEINTIPGFTSISMFPKLWEYSGLPYEKLLDRLIELAFERHAEVSQNKLSFETKNWYN